ncbi:MAG: hypothetical protein IKU07_07240 [Oscillospiraceae bacterium]|nr:hypothetical protein [Oscillospiraceae bacterium]
MKKSLCIMLLAFAVLLLCACNGGTAETTAPTEPACDATETDIAALEALYAGRTPYYGEMHDHSNSGGRSDGRISLSVWKSGLLGLEMDFATIVDHKQVRHMVLPEWDDSVFIGGTEAATTMLDLPYEVTSFHYNMIFTDPNALLELLTEHEEFNFKGTALDGEFPYYPKYKREQLEALVQSVRDKGGMFVHVHPKHNGVLDSDDPLDYWYGDWTGIEVMNTYKSDRNGPNTQKNYQLWVDLLALGKKVWATSGNDEHGMPSDKAISVVYAEEKNAESFFSHIRIGDFTCGPVGIRMCVGDTVTGYETDFTGKRLVFSVGDLHKTVKNPYHTYRVDLINDAGIVFSKEITCEETFYFALDAENCKFYRVEVWDTTDNSRIGIGNPIWNIQ